MPSCCWTSAMAAPLREMLTLPVKEGTPRHIRDFDPTRLSTRRIVMGNHCYGCTAGAGSSCSGAVMKANPTQ